MNTFNLDSIHGINFLITNVYGENRFIFLKREAVRFVEKIKIPSFDLIFTEHQDVGAKLLFEFMTRLYMDDSNQSMDDYLALAPKSNGTQLTQTTQSKIKSSTATLLYKGVPVDKLQFHHIKDFHANSTSKFGYTYAFINRYDKDLKDIYYQPDLSLLTSMFFTCNINAMPLNPKWSAQFPSSKTVDDFRSYLQSLYNKLSENEKSFYRDPIQFIPRGSYKINRYLDRTKITLYHIKKEVSRLMGKNFGTNLLAIQEGNRFIDEWQKAQKEKYPIYINHKR